MLIASFKTITAKEKSTAQAVLFSFGLRSLRQFVDRLQKYGGVLQVLRGEARYPHFHSQKFFGILKGFFSKGYVTTNS